VPFAALTSAATASSGLLKPCCADALVAMSSKVIAIVERMRDHINDRE
jgi:hypothetical protein